MRLGLLVAGLVLSSQVMGFTQPKWCSDDNPKSEAEKTVCADVVLSKSFSILDQQWEQYITSNPKKEVESVKVYLDHWKENFLQPCESHIPCINVALELAKQAPFMKSCETSVATTADNESDELAQLEKKARDKDYQAQRNLASKLGSGALVGASYKVSSERQIQACAWRYVIIKSGSDQVSTGDQANFSIDCDPLEPTQLDQAARQASKLLAEIYER